MAERLLQLVEKRFGKNHTNYTVALNNLAVVYETQGRYGEAMGGTLGHMETGASSFLSRNGEAAHVIRVPALSELG